MGKYDDKLINDYISGEEIDNIDSLENDWHFMKQVIDKSGDYKLYNLCSDNVKNNYEFVKYLVLKFSRNADFITKIADYYLNNCNDEFSKTELIAILTDIPMNYEKKMYYRMIGHSLYYFKRVQVEACKKNDELLSKELGMGFFIVYEEFNESEIILNFYAKKIIDGIFEEYGISLDKLMHDSFDSPLDITRIGINNFLLNFIGKYDEMLSDYLCVHIELLDDLKKDISSIINKWDKYIDTAEREKYYLMFDKVHEYLSGVDCVFGETTIIYYLGNKLGIADKILQYDLSLTGCSLEDVLSDINEDDIKATVDFSFNDRLHLYQIKKIMLDSLSMNSPKEDYQIKKILRIDFNKRK